MLLINRIKSSWLDEGRCIERPWLVERRCIERPWLVEGHYIERRSDNNPTSRTAWS